MCDRDCFHCQYEDCFIDNVSPEEVKAQIDFDKEIMLERKHGKEAQRYKVQMKYRRSDKGSKTIKRCASSNRAKEYKKKYEHSDLGKRLARERARRYRERKRIMMTVYDKMRSVEYRSERSSYEA